MRERKQQGACESNKVMYVKRLPMTIIISGHVMGYPIDDAAGSSGG